MQQLSIPDIIKLADISVPLSANYVADGSLFGPRLNTTNPVTIAIVADALRWHNESFPAIALASATATIKVDTIGEAGDTIAVPVNDPNLGTILLGSYTVLPTDTTTTITATNIGIALSSNPYGYGINTVDDTITITAAPGTGSAINGGNNIDPIISTGINLLAAESGSPLITETSINIITE